MNINRYLLLVCLALSSGAMAENLEETYQQVLQSDPRLLIESLSVEIGEDREDQAFGALLPQVTLNSNWTENKRRVERLSNDDSYSGERYTLSVRQSLIDMPKYYGWRQAKIVSEQYSSQLKDTQSVVRLDTIERYFKVLSAKDILALTQEEKNATQTKFEQTKALYDKQLVKVTEFYEVEARLDKLASEELDAMQALALAKEGLNELTNNEIQAVSPLMESTDYIERIENLDDWIESAVANNSALQALKKGIDAAQQSVRKQYAGHYPVLDLQLSQQKSDIGFENSSSSKSVTGVAGLNLTIPLYSGGQTSARVSEATKQLALAQAKYDQEYRKVIKELRDRFLSVNSLVRRAEAATKAIASAEKSNQAMSKSFELGIATISDVLDAQQAYSQAKRDFQQAKYDYIVNKARLNHVAGKLDDAAFYQISNWLM